MAEAIHINKEASKEEIYQDLLPQIKALIESEEDLIANLANVAAVLHEAFGYLWTGFYIRRGDDLVLGPFQGPLACTRIPVKPAPRGVCGQAAAQQKTLVVEDVDKFPGHIACSSLSKSEIVVPLISSGRTELVLDIDSDELSSFDANDALYLEEIIGLIRAQHFLSFSPTASV